MIALSLGEVAAIVGGRLVDADPSAQVTGSVEYDSRLVSAGGLFVALPGERVDGHDYVTTAADRGAAAALVTRPVAGAHIEVDDGVAALTTLAAAVARRLPALAVVGVTGSSGKTSTKDLLAHLLARLGPTVAPAGSMNNELGLPYTVLRADESTRFLVLEMGARGIGHIRHLAAIVAPSTGVVLNVGSAHLGEFGSREAIAQAKGELVEALDADGLAVLNADDVLVRAMAGRTVARVVLTGLAPDAGVRAENVALDELGRASFTLHASGQRVPVSLRLVGAHHVANALAAAAVAIEAGMPVDDVAVALGEAVPASRWRMEVTERRDGVVVINDAYNANPESMRAALQALASVARSRRAGGGRSFAVLGQMAELGPDGPAEHEALGGVAAGLHVSRVVAVGELARPILAGAALDDSWTGESTWVPDVEAAVRTLRAELRPGDVVLVKASRAASLERVALAIADDDSAGDASTGGDSPDDESADPDRTGPSGTEGGTA